MTIPLIEYSDGVIFCNGHEVAVVREEKTDLPVRAAIEEFLVLLHDLQAQSEGQENDSLDNYLPLEDQINLFIAEHAKAGFISIEKTQAFIARLLSKGEEE
jgi:hypothetical protein